MKIKLNEYISKCESDIRNNNLEKDMVADLFTWIQFFQHERLVHLIVTFFTGVATILFLLGALYFGKILLYLLFFIALLLFIAYIFHYYYLENGVQKLYNIYFDAKQKIK